MNKDNLNDGGPAFPTAVENGCNSGCPGMSLREHFAGLAMQGELSAMCATDEDPNSGLSLSVPDETLDRLAKHWFRIADAMIRAGGEA